MMIKKEKLKELTKKGIEKNYNLLKNTIDHEIKESASLGWEKIRWSFKDVPFVIIDKIAEHYKKEFNVEIEDKKSIYIDWRE